MPRTCTYNTNRTLRNASHHALVRIRNTTYHRFFPHSKSVKRIINNSSTFLYSYLKNLITKKANRNLLSVFFSWRQKNVCHTMSRREISLLNAYMFKIQKSNPPMCSCGYPQEGAASSHAQNTLYNETCYSTTYPLSYIATSIKYPGVPNPKSCFTLRGPRRRHDRVEACRFKNFLLSSHKCNSMGYKNAVLG